MKTNIIDLIRRNRISATEVSDCLGKTGAIKNAHIVNRGHFKVGELRWVYAAAETNWDVHEQIQYVEDNEVVFIDQIDSSDKAIFGDLVSKYLSLYKQTSAIVTNGLLRDAPRLIKENWSIWCKGFCPVGFVNEKKTLSSDLLGLIEEKKDYYADSIGVCDDSGVVVITKEFLNEDFYNRLLSIEEQEDIWFECIDRRKYSTFDTVCLKKYLYD